MLNPMAANRPRIILFDLETLPDVFAAFRKWTQLSNYPGLTLRASITSIICFGYKVLGEDNEVKCINAWDFPDWKENKNNDYRVARAAYKVLSTADAVVTQNGKNFDWPYLQTRLALNGMEFLKEVPHIDTKTIAKSKLRMFNNSLNTLGELVGDQKIDNGGWSLWEKVWADDDESKKLMEDYCKQDVLLLEKVYLKLRPLAKNIPNHNNFVDQPQNVCPSCGSYKLQKDGTRLQMNGLMQRYKCTECATKSSVKIQSVRPKIKANP